MAEKYLVQADRTGSTLLYTLDEMADFFSVSIRMTDRVRKAVREDQQPKHTRRRGYEALNLQRLRQFEMLRAHRGHFKKGRLTR